MTRPSFRLMLPGFVLLPTIAVYAGGWATISVEDLPDYVVARQPVAVTFTVRQHGNKPMDGLRARVEAEGGGLRARAAATPGRETGRYSASLTLPEPGEWAITIHSGFGDGRVTLIPLSAVAAGAGSAPRLSEAERGRRLFVAKGCVTCHVHGEAGETNKSLPVGPDLTGRRYAADYLKLFLANPAIRPPASDRALRMPNLNLKPPEIAALTAFLKAERQALR